MVMLNDLDRFHLVIDVIDRVPGPRGARRAPAAGDGRPRACAPAPTRASTARTTRRSATGPGRTDGVLVVNAGSTSLKLSLVDDDERVRRTVDVARRGARRRRGRRRTGSSTAATRFREPVLIDDDGASPSSTRARRARAAAQRARARRRSTRRGRRCPDVPHVAVFDTAFHATIPAEARDLRAAARAGARTGASAATASTASRSQWARRAACAVPRLVVCHLGGGCSVTAVRDGRSVDTTMGFSPLEGVPMATRSGSVDPGRSLYLLRHGACDPRRARARARARVGAARPLRALGARRGARGRRGTGTARPSSRSTSSRTASRRPLRRMPLRSAGSTRSSSPPASASAPPRSARDVCARLALPRRRARRAANEAAGADAEIGATGSPCASWLSRARGSGDRP